MKKLDKLVLGILYKTMQLKKCVKCGWEICCIRHFEDHVAIAHKNLN